MSQIKYNKDLNLFPRRTDCLETKPELLTDYITPNSHFFTCQVTPTPAVNLDNYTLKIHGDGVKRPLALSYDALFKLPSRTVISYLEWAGNHRDLFDRIMGRPIEEAADGFGITKWLTGGVGNAVWMGVSLKTLLEMAGLDPATPALPNPPLPK